MESPRLDFKLFGVQSGERTDGFSDHFAMKLSPDIRTNLFLARESIYPTSRLYFKFFSSKTWGIRIDDFPPLLTFE